MQEPGLQIGVPQAFERPVHNRRCAHTGKRAPVPKMCTAAAGRFHSDSMHMGMMTQCVPLCSYSITHSCLHQEAVDKRSQITPEPAESKYNTLETVLTGVAMMPCEKCNGGNDITHVTSLVPRESTGGTSITHAAV